MKKSKLKIDTRAERESDI